jgi:hypothetical protein
MEPNPKPTPAACAKALMVQKTKPLYCAALAELWSAMENTEAGECPSVLIDSFMTHKVNQESQMHRDGEYQQP